MSLILNLPVFEYEKVFLSTLGLDPTKKYTRNFVLDHIKSLSIKQITLSLCYDSKSHTSKVPICLYKFDYDLCSYFNTILTSTNIKEKVLFSYAILDILVSKNIIENNYSDYYVMEPNQLPAVTDINVTI